MKTKPFTSFAFWMVILTYLTLPVQSLALSSDQYLASRISADTYPCTQPPIVFDVWGVTNTCGGELFNFGLTDSEPGTYYIVYKKFENEYFWADEFWGDGERITLVLQSGDYYILGINECDSTWMNGHADLYPFDTRVKITVSENNICSGDEVIFNANSYQPDSVICTYNWKINGYGDWNPDPGELEYIPENGDYISAEMATPCQHDDLHFPDNNRILMMVNDCPGIKTTWNGSISENWYEQNNWDNGIPDANTIAFIPGGLLHYPTLTTAAICSSIVIEHGGSFIGSEFLNHKSALVKCNFSDAEYHFLSSPVNPSPLFGEVFPLNQNTVWARKYQERYGDWVNLTKYDHFELAKGYSMQLTLPNTAQFIGLLNGTNSSTHIENYNTSGIADRAGWNLIGNPFPSSIDWDLIPHTFIENAVYVWNGSQYISWNGTVGALENGIIPPMNGFFVKMTASYWKNFTIPIIARVHGNVPFYKESPCNLLELTVSGEEYADKTFIHFYQDATATFDPEYDAWKLRGIEEAPQLFSYAGGNELSINELPFWGSEVIELGFKCGESGNFILNGKGLESFNNNVRILLEDVKEGIFQNLSENAQYSFSYIAGESEHRFKLYFTENSSNPEPSEVNIYSHGKTLIVNNYTGLSGEVQVYDFTGRMILNSSIDSRNQSSFNLKTSTGPYIVKVITAVGVFSQKVVIM
jgi:hypothetical protein